MDKVRLRTWDEWRDVMPDGWDEENEIPIVAIDVDVDNLSLWQGAPVKELIVYEADELVGTVAKSTFVERAMKIKRRPNMSEGENLFNGIDFAIVFRSPKNGRSVLIGYREEEVTEKVRLETKILMILMLPINCTGQSHRAKTL